jgi:lipoate-protein ligase A
VPGPALVLGSGQQESVVDVPATAAAGVEVTRRRSGGGAVLVGPHTLWLDVVVPAADPLWDGDVRRSFHWLGEAWAAALGRVGLAGEVHRGGMVEGPWSRLVCFAGLGPGEVVVGGRKAVGLSQRRTRGGSLFQCLVVPRFDARTLLDLLALDEAARAAALRDIPDRVAVLPADDAFTPRLLDAALAEITAR